MKFALNQNYKWQLVEASSEEYSQLTLLLTRKIPKWQFHPLVKKKVWDGNICLFKNNEIGAGLHTFVEKSMKEFGYDVIFDGGEFLNNEIDFEKFKAFCDRLFENHEKIKPYDYQIYSAYRILTSRISRIQVATSGGKTIISYLIFAYLVSKKIVTKEKPFLLIVPRLQLVGQAVKDFYDYSNGKIDGGIVADGIDTSANKIFTVGSYQSLTKKDSSFLSKFSVVGIDEAHQVKANSIKKILENTNMNSVFLRYGVTGTFPSDSTIDELTYIEFLGDIKDVISPNFLIENSYATKIRIKMILLDYAEDKIKKDFRLIRADENIEPQTSLKMEHDFIRMSDKRLDFIAKLAYKLPQNTLILFNDIKGNYGLNIVKTCKNYLKDTDRNVYYIDGSVSLESRLEICERLENEKGSILVASYGTLAVGVSIKNLHNEILAESMSSEIIIRQTIGRAMRLHESKKHSTVYDIVDDYSVGVNSEDYVRFDEVKNKRKGANYTLTQAKKRHSYYLEDGHDIEIITKQI